MDQRTFAYCDCQTGWQTFAVFFAVGRGITRPSGRRLPFFAVGRGIARPSGRRLPFFTVGRGIARPSGRRLPFFAVGRVFLSQKIVG